VRARWAVGGCNVKSSSTHLPLIQLQSVPSSIPVPGLRREMGPRTCCNIIRNKLKASRRTSCPSFRTTYNQGAGPPFQHRTTYSEYLSAEKTSSPNEYHNATPVVCTNPGPPIILPQSKREPPMYTSAWFLVWRYGPAAPSRAAWAFALA